MDDFRSAPGIHHEPAQTDDHSIADSDRQDIFTEVDNPNQIITHAPKERFRLGYFDVVCLILNRTIGTGIFNSPRRVVQGTGSTSVSLLFWFAGIVYCLAGAHVYCEYGLSVPRYTVSGIEQAVPRSGGDLNYLMYVFRKPSYRGNSVLLITCVFGISFVFLGNMFANCINFARCVLLAAGRAEPGQSDGAVMGITFSIAILTCFIHAISRRGGIWLSNIFAVIKVAILLFIIITAVVVGAGGLPTENVIVPNTSTSQFKEASTGPNAYAHAFLAVMFSFSGFEQPNYVLGEISNPRRKFPISMGIGISIICVLYMAVNIAYNVVVPHDEQAQFNVAQRFIEKTYGSLGENSAETSSRIFNAFLALSSLGNIIVMTYTAARVKQEIAKEGILPWPKFFAQNTDLSVGRLLCWFQKKGWFLSILRRRWFSPEQHREKTPVGALILHLLSCFVLIFATWGMSPSNAYNLLTSLSSYVINGFFGTFLGLGILILRFHGPPQTEAVEDDDELDNSQVLKKKPKWRELAGSGFNPTVSVIAAFLFMLGNIYPIIVTWVPPSEEPRVGELRPWYLVPTISWCIIAFGCVWFLAFVAWAWNVGRKQHRVFVVEKKQSFEPAQGPGTADVEGRCRGGLVMVHETVYLNWVGKETLRHRAKGEEKMRSSSVVVGADPFAGTDFAGFGGAQHGATQGFSQTGFQQGSMSQDFPQQNFSQSGFSQQRQPSYPQASYQPNPGLAPHELPAQGYQSGFQRPY